MTPNNQFSNKQLEVLRKEGWIDYQQQDGSMLQLVKYGEHSKVIPSAPILVQFDFRFNRLLVIEQNIFNYKETPQPKYDAQLPHDIADTIQILNLCKAITAHQKERLHLNRFDA